MKQYQAAWRRDPPKSRLYLKRQIEVLMRQGKRSEAGALNAEILRENPNDDDAHVLAGSLLADKGDLNGALAELQAVAVRAPENPLVHFNLGRVYNCAASGTRRSANSTRLSNCVRITFRRAWPGAIAGDARRIQRGGENGRRRPRFDEGNTMSRLIQSAALTGQKKFGEARQLLEDALKGEPGSLR